MESERPLTFAEQVRAIPGGEHLDMCYSCGTCVSRCLIQQKLEPEYNPRRLLRMVMLEMREEAFESPTTWLCSACVTCATRLPAGDPYIRGDQRGQAVGHGSRLSAGYPAGQSEPADLCRLRLVRRTGLPLRSHYAWRKPMFPSEARG